MIKEKVYQCIECSSDLKFDIVKFQENPKAPTPFYCEKCKKYFGWAEGKEQEAFDYLKQRLCLKTYEEIDWCKKCNATGNSLNFTGEFEECSVCEGFGLVGKALLKEKEIEVKEQINRNKNKGKGVKIDVSVSKEMRRLKAQGMSINDGKITYKIPKEVQERNRKEFLKKKKARKLAKKSKKRKR